MSGELNENLLTIHQLLLIASQGEWGILHSNLEAKTLLVDFILKNCDSRTLTLEPVSLSLHVTHRHYLIIFCVAQEDNQIFVC